MSDYAEIRLSDGSVVKVDPDDYLFLRCWRWKRHIGGYACRSAGSPKKGYLCVLMHRVIANTPAGMEVDHINGDKLDNRRCNLRNVNRSTNEYNKATSSNNTSGHRGICWDKNKHAWLVRASRKYLGRYENLSEAIRRRDTYLSERGIVPP